MVCVQAALEFVEERSAGTGVTSEGPDSPPPPPALLFLHQALYQEECLAIDSDIQLIGMLEFLNLFYLSPSSTNDTLVFTLN